MNCLGDLFDRWQKLQQQQLKLGLWQRPRLSDVASWRLSLSQKQTLCNIPYVRGLHNLPSGTAACQSLSFCQGAFPIGAQHVSPWWPNELKTDGTWARLSGKKLSKLAAAIRHLILFIALWMHWAACSVIYSSSLPSFVKKDMIGCDETILWLPCFSSALHRLCSAKPNSDHPLGMIELPKGGSIWFPSWYRKPSWGAATGCWAALHWIWAIRLGQGPFSCRHRFNHVASHDPSARTHSIHD